MRLVKHTGNIIAAFIVIFFVVAMVAERDHLETFGYQTDLKNIGRGVRRYNATYQSLPPAYVEDADHRRLHSWRALLLPCISPATADAFGYRYDEPWNSPFNTSLHNKRVMPYFHCSGDPSPINQTSYVAVLGSDTLLPGTSPRKLEEIPGTTTVMSRGDLRPTYRGASLSNTILFAEMHQSGIHWLEPRDITLDDALKGVNATTPSISGSHLFSYGLRRGPMVLFADGRVQFLKSNIDPKILRSLLEVKNPDKPKERYFTFP